MRCNMDTFFSFIYPSANSPRGCSFDPELSMNELGMNLIFDCRKLPWKNLFTFDAETILYRQEIFRDLLNLPELCELCNKTVNSLESLNGLFQARDGSGDNESNLYKIKEVELFIDFLEDIYAQSKEISDKVKSRAFCRFFDMIKSTAESEDFLALREGVKKLELSIKSIKSVTVGINLDATLTPYESGLLSINSEYFRSGDIVTRFMQMNLKKDEMTTIAPLNPLIKLMKKDEKAAITTTLNSVLSKIVGSGFRSWKEMLRRYSAINTKEFVILLPELRFLTSAVSALMKIKALNLPLCYPEVRPANERRFSATGIYSPVTACKIRENNLNEVVILNDITFDKDGMFYVLTGPNRGGKSVILEAVGIAQYMFQMGLPVSAKSFTASPVDAVYTHFPVGTDDTTGKGRFGEECARLQQILRRVSPESMVLLDETLSGTDSYEASTIGKEVLTALSVIGCRGIFSTHLHLLSMEAKDINMRADIHSRVDNLVMSIENGQRTYKVCRRTPDGKSYARDIADRYNLSLEKILESNKAEKDNTLN